MSNLYTLNVDQVVNGIKNGEFTSEEYVSQIIERIKKVDKKINMSFMHPISTIPVE